MARTSPIIRAGTLILESSNGDNLVKIPVESDAWYRWLEAARAFAFEDASGHFTARKKRRWGSEYWYAFRRKTGRLYEAYLGRARDITLGRMRAAAAKLNQATGKPPDSFDQRSASHQMETPTGHSPSGKNSFSASRTSATEPIAPHVQLSQLIHTAAVDRLAQAMECSLTLLCAPAGYGKTTLLAQWTASMRLPTVWLTLDERDNDPVRFWTRLSGALGKIAPGLLETLRKTAGPGGFGAADDMRVAFISALVKVPTPILVILDDYQQLRPENTAIHEIIGQFVAQLPSGAHLVVASRGIPPLPVAQLRARHQLLELSAADLQFTLSETRAFFSRRMKLDLSGEQIAVLHARTEGWVTALQLAGVSLQAQSDVDAWFTDFNGKNRHIFDYLIEEVVKRLPAAIYTFALQTSILDRLSGPLCDAVTRSNNSQATLEEMERANIFLVPLDDHREWYRYHHLFADVLRRYLRLTQPRLAQQLNARASTWCASHELPLDAIDYAFAANQLDFAAQLVEEYIQVALAQGSYGLLRERLQRLPDSLVRERPRLCMAHAYTLYLAGERAAFLQRVRDAEGAVTRSAHAYSRSELVILRGEILALQAFVRILLGDGSPHALLASLQKAQAGLPRGHEFQTFIMLLAGTLHAGEGNVRAASRTLTNLLRASEAKGNRYYVGFVTFILGIVTLIQGRLRETLELCNRAAQHLAGYGDDDLVALLDVIRGNVFYERNDLDLALEYLRHGVTARYDRSQVLIEGSSALAYVYLALGDSAAADETIERSLREWEGAPAESSTLWAWTGRRLRAHQARLRLLEGDVAAASDWAREMERAAYAETTASNAPTVYIREWGEIVLARMYLAEGRAGEALALLNALGASAEAAGRLAPHLEIRVLQVVAHAALDDIPTALDTLRQAVELGAPQRYMRTFVEGGPVIRRLLPLIQDEGQQRVAGTQRRREARLQRYAGALLAAFAPADQSGAYRRLRPVTQTGAEENLAESLGLALTPREREVIRLIAEGASNAEIARRLVIAKSTAKRHVSNIFETLSVGSRTQAVARARELGYLSPGE